METEEDCPKLRVRGLTVGYGETAVQHNVRSR